MQNNLVVELDGFVVNVNNWIEYAGLADKVSQEALDHLETWFEDADMSFLNFKAVEVLEKFQRVNSIPEKECLAVVGCPISEFEQMLWIGSRS